MMSEEPVALFTPEQRESLLTLRAVWEEGEDEERLERLRQREDDAAILRGLSGLLEMAHFSQGGSLTYAQMGQFLTLVRALAPNPNLDARLLRQAGEPERFQTDLRDLLYGPASIANRLRQFLNLRHAGAQTLLQLLCAAFPTEWPLVTPAALQSLTLSDVQQTQARETARSIFDLPAEVQGVETRSNRPVHVGIPDNDPVLRLLSDVIVFRAVRELLEAPDYVRVHRLLTASSPGRSAAAKRARTLANATQTISGRNAASYARRDDRAFSAEAEAVRERDGGGYAVGNRSSDESDDVGGELPPDLDVSGLKVGDALADMEAAIAAQGFVYPALTVRSYFLSLQSKPFVLLTGLSGTGKTRLTSLFAEALTGQPGVQYRSLPVRPDWHDSTSLLGYVNLLAPGRDGNGQFVTTPFLDFVQRAARPANTPYPFFVCLDEINLARVEHYLAEVLSALETPKRELILPNGQTFRLPANLFLTGTLNLDEATHPLTRKVLDRANVLSFSDVMLDAPTVPTETAPHLTPAQRQALFLQTRLPDVQAARQHLAEIGEAVGTGDLNAVVLQILMEANALLQAHGQHFAYRIRDEITRFCAHSYERDAPYAGLLLLDAPDDARGNLHTALDLQLVQKVWPRLSGTALQMEALLQTLRDWATQRRLTRSAQLLERMQATLARDGFVALV